MKGRSPQKNLQRKPGADEKIAGELDAAKQLQSTESYIFPPVYLLKEGEQPDGQDLSEELKANAQLLVDALASFGVQTCIIDIARGLRSPGMSCSLRRGSKSARSPIWPTILL